MFIKTRKAIKRFLRQVFKSSGDDYKDDLVEGKEDVVKIKEEPKKVEVKEEPKKVEVKEEPKKVEVKEEPKEEPKKVEIEKPSTEPKYHVSYNRDPKSDNFRRWRVRRAGSRKTIKFFDTQLEAIEFAQRLADSNNTSIVIHKMDGSIRKQDYSK